MQYSDVCLQIILLMPRIAKAEAMTEPASLRVSMMPSEQLSSSSLNYSKFQDMMMREKARIDISQSSKLTFKLGYMLVLVLILGSLSYAVYGSYQQHADMATKEETDVSQCLERFTERSCSYASSISSNPASDECKRLLECIRKRSSSGLLIGIWTVLSNSTLIKN